MPEIQRRLRAPCDGHCGVRTKGRKLMAYAPEFNVEAWHRHLDGMCIPCEIAPLPHGLLDAINSFIHEGGKVALLAQVERIAEPLIARVGGRAFVRLGSRSPKDAYAW